MQKLRYMDESGGWCIICLSSAVANTVVAEWKQTHFVECWSYSVTKHWGEKITWTWSLCRTSTMWIRKRGVKELVNPAGTLWSCDLNHQWWLTNGLVSADHLCVVCSAHKDLIITKTSENSLRHRTEKMSLHLLKLGWITLLSNHNRYCRVKLFAYITVWQTFLHVRCHHSDGKLSTSANNPDLSVRTHLAKCI